MSSAPSTATSSKLPSVKAPAIPWYKRIFPFMRLTYIRIARYWWAWEFLAAFLSLAATASLIAVLAYEDGRVQKPFDLGSTSISLNTVVAALATVIRTLLTVAIAGPLNQSAWNWFSSSRKSNEPQAGRPLKDLDTFGDASVDSFSSLKLLWRTKLRSLAAVGAIIVVLSLAFDTFAQQVLGSRVRSVISSGPSTSTNLPRSSAYHYYTGSAHTSTVLPLDVQGVLLSSIFTSNISIPAGICSTGNCTWPTTPTLGVCSSCKDVKSKITKTNTTVEISNTSTPVLVPAIRYSLPVHIEQLESLEVTYQKSSGLNFETNLSVIAPTSQYTPDVSDQILIAQIFALGVPPSKADSLLDAYSTTVLQTEILDSLVVAYDCALYFCLQAYEAETTSGITHQHVTTTWHQFMTTTEPNPGGDPYSFAYVGYNFTDVPDSMNIRNVSDYTIDDTSRGLLAIALAPAIGGNVTINTNDYIPHFSGTGAISYTDGEHSPTAQAFLSATSTIETMHAQIQQIADGLTAFMRTNIPAEADDRYAPMSYEQRIFVHVRWPWLAYPLSLLVAGYIFLFLTIWHTNRLRVRPWKSHRMPYLLATIDEDIRHLAFGGLDGRNGLKERLGESKVHLYYDNIYELAFKRS